MHAPHAGSRGSAPVSELFLRQDMRDEVRWQEVIAETLRHFGALHVLVNKAGAAKMGSDPSGTGAVPRQRTDAG